MVKILVGSYTNTIYTLDFDPTADQASRLTLSSSIDVGFHPSWIAPHPNNGNIGGTIVFTGLEQEVGEIVVVSFDADGKGKIEASGISTRGADPCTVLVTKDEVIAGNYSSGSVTFLPLAQSAPFLQPDSPTTTIQLSGSGPNQDRQLASHAHQVISHPTREELLVPDLGADKVWRLVKGNDVKWDVRGHVSYTPGDGPRHVAFYKAPHGAVTTEEPVMYTLVELVSGLTAHRLPPLPAEPVLTHTTSTLSNPLPLPNDMLAAEILVSSTSEAFPEPYLYISNRNDPSPEGDTIAIFDLKDKEKPVLIEEVRTGLKHVRGIVLGGQGEKWLVAGGVLGGGVKVFERTEGGKNLVEVAAVSEEDVKAATGFLWI
ncbi:hypothetical protein HWV62_2033 [Athelia sp. TMB]|nr:hypothetical protein HWV62_2033 [Athelia sp. TMB]